MEKISKGRSVGGRPTLKDIAQEVGVTITTASYVLNGAKSGTRVSDKTREAILEAARRFGYRPNNVARSLVRQRSGVVAIYSGYEELSAKNYFFAEIMGGLQVGCAQCGVDLLIHTGPPEADDHSIAQSLLDGRADGVIVHASTHHQLPHIIAESRVPAVAIVDQVDFLPSVVVDDAEGGRIQARYLHEKGHRRVMYRPAFCEYASTIRRETAFREEAAALGLEVVDGTMTVAGGWSGLTDPEKRIMLGPDRPTAIACWEDMNADQTVADLEEMGFSVPGDVAVMGYNGISVEFGRRRWLTTIDAHWALVAETAIKVLMRRVAGEEVPMGTTLPVDLLEGATA
ncbi:MAG: LacI family DNA-binding transcriptional regulator [Armatimonadetes bacterium]|nr:LacI family DNA-binding transcriptional regulator [Armatimonadota bacterium]